MSNNFDSSNSRSQTPTTPWTVEGFGRFWKNPNSSDLNLINHVVWPNITGFWPRAQNPLIGADAYIQGCANLIEAIENFSVEVCDFAQNGDIVFVRWEASGIFPVGPQVMNGVDRLLLRDGFVLENRIHSDHPIFEYLAKRKLLG